LPSKVKRETEREREIEREDGIEKRKKVNKKVLGMGGGGEYIAEKRREQK
jgi:hypothetical protein